MDVSHSETETVGGQNSTDPPGAVSNQNGEEAEQGHRDAGEQTEPQPARATPAQTEPTPRTRALSPSASRR
jgi:hypothetical protein